MLSSCSLVKPIHKIALASVSDFATLGCSESFGNLGIALDTFSLTSLAADSMSLDKLNSILICEISSLLADFISLIFEIPDNESSSICVISLSIISAEAPRYTVDTVTTGLSISGYSLIDNLSYETSPISTKNILITAARTGLRTVISDMCIYYSIIFILDPSFSFS